jgi:hypothetical protein
VRQVADQRIQMNHKDLQAGLKMPRTRIGAIGRSF